ncbi:MAG TPA: ribulose-phosphate 3-epimerase [Terriglobia bacterium]|nr:ribulose-phosphate 3-epimerase [Terriglobia bacterium]
MSHPTSLRTLRDQSPTLSVGMMTADLLSLGSELLLIEEAGARVVHIDVMDGVYCPQMTAGPPLIRAMKTPLLKDVHLMVAEPLGKIPQYVAAGADIITIHPEACAHPHRVLQEMGGMVNANDAGRGLIRGVALNPGTSLNVLEPLLDEAELVLLLAVNPGWGGQAFIPSTLGRIAKMKQMIQNAGKEILLGVDGGITRKNVAEISQTGVDIIVAGSAVFDGKAPRENARFMLSALRAPNNY